jgi:hypothetical protein
VCTLVSLTSEKVEKGTRGNSCQSTEYIVIVSNFKHTPEAEKVLRVFLLVIHSHLYALPWDFYFFKLTQPLKVSVKEKAGKPEIKLYPLPYGFRNPYRNLKSENSQDYAQKPQENKCSWIWLQYDFLPLGGGGGRGGVWGVSNLCISV